MQAASRHLHGATPTCTVPPAWCRPSFEGKRKVMSSLISFPGGVQVTCRGGKLWETANEYGKTWEERHLERVIPNK